MGRMVDHNGGGLGNLLAWVALAVLGWIYGPDWFQAIKAWLHQVTA